jgi:hypothetical protein
MNDRRAMGHIVALLFVDFVPAGAHFYAASPKRQHT